MGEKPQSRRPPTGSRRRGCFSPGPAALAALTIAADEDRSYQSLAVAVAMAVNYFIYT